MAEKTGLQDNTVAWASLHDGRDIPITPESVAEYMNGRADELRDSGALSLTLLGGGLVRLDVNLDAITAESQVEFAEDTGIPIGRGQHAQLRAGVPYFAILPAPGDTITDVEIWTCARDAIRTDQSGVWEYHDVRLTRTDPETGEDVEATSDSVYLTETDEAGETITHTLGEAGLDPATLASMWNTATGRGVTLWDLILGLYVLIGTVGVATQNQSAQRKKRARKSDYSRKESGNVTNAGLTMTNGPLTNALMARNKGEISPEEYFTDGSVRVDTGDGGFVMLDVRAGDETEIDAAYREYRLNDRDRFWLDPLYTLAIENGRQTIEGSEILKLRGYANPYAESAATTMADALKSISKAMSTRVAIDVTSEKRNRRKGNARLVSSTRLQPVVNATVDLDKYEDESGGGVKDFTINLQTPDPIDALPLAKYERARKMLTTVSASDFDFKSVRKLTTDDRQMWSYVLRIIKSNKLSGTILFETMWRNMELREPDVSPYAYTDREGKPLTAPLKNGGEPIDPRNAEKATSEQIERRRRDAIRKQRARMLKKLESMLDEKQAKGKKGAEKDEAVFQGWEWHKDQAGRVVGVKIHRFSPAKSTS